jgi:fluoride exporter
MAFAIEHIGIVAVSGMVGGIARFWLSGFIAHRIGERFPWGTLVVNVSGAFAIGALAALLPAFGSGSGASLTLWLALAIGILGSYTTVSSFSLQTLALLRERELLRALLNIITSLSLCLSAAIAGYLSIMETFGN